MIYVMSDIHGRIDKFHAMLSKINFSDSDILYILGDIIDRGSDGIQIFEEIIDKNNIKFICGNHEDMMLAYLDAKKIADKSDDVGDILWEKKKEVHWMQRNGGLITYTKYCELPVDRQKAIYEYIQQAPIAYPYVYVNHRCFYLAHAFVARGITPTYKLPIYRNDVNEEDLKNVIWERFLDMPYTKRYGNLECLKRKKLIIGHTPTSLFVDSHKELQFCSIYHGDGFIGIDCGCALPDSLARLGAICLDTMEEFYV